MFTFFSSWTSSFKAYTASTRLLKQKIQKILMILHVSISIFSFSFPKSLGNTFIYKGYTWLPTQGYVVLYNVNIVYLNVITVVSLQRVNESLFSKAMIRLLFFNNRLPVALHLLHNDLLFLWQKDRRDALFPHRCAHMHKIMGRLDSWLYQQLNHLSSMFLTQARTCAGLVQAGSRAVRLDHPQYLGVFL